MGVFDRLIARGAARRGAVPDSVWRSVEHLMVPQLELLGTIAGKVPVDANTGKKWSRGYVLGIGCQAVQVEAREGVDDRLCFDRALAAFACVYGPKPARGLLVETIDEALGGDAEVWNGLEISARDAELVADECSPRSPHAFWEHNRQGTLAA